MDPARKKKFRIAAVGAAALLLVVALFYVTMGAATEAKSPSDLVGGGRSGGTYQLTGKVRPGTVERRGGTLKFGLTNRDGTGPVVPVVYRGTVPDPFREGREVVISGEYRDGTFMGRRDTLITKCPSKFSKEKA